MTASTTPSVESLLIHDAFLRRVVRYLVSNGDDVDDVVQEVWVAALKRPPRQRDAARSWLWSVASNVVRLRVRSKVRSRNRERLRARPDIAPSSQEIRDREAVRSMVLEELLTLPEDGREVLLLRFFEDLSWKDVAQRLGVPPETARTRAKRARAQLRERLAKRSGGDRSAVLLLLPLLEIQHAGPLAKLSPWLVARIAALLLVVLGAGFMGWSLLQDDTEPADGLPADLTATGSGGPESATPGGDPSAALRGTRRSTETPTTALPEGRWRIAGRVVDEAGDALVGVRVHAGDVAQTDMALLAAKTLSGADGGFELIISQPPQALRLTAHASGRAPDVRIVRRAQDRVRLVLPATGVRHFLLRDHDTNEELADVTCRYVAKRFGHEIALAAVSDAGGRLAIDVPWPTAGRRSASLRFTRGGYAPLFHDQPHALRAMGGVTKETAQPIYLRRAEGLAVHVQDEAGRAVVGARVQAWSCGRLGNPVVKGAAFIQGGSTEVLSLGDVQTDATGRTQIAEPPMGRTIAVLVTTESERGYATAVSFGVGRTGDIKVHIRPTTTLHGVVVANGVPVSDAEVALPIDAVLDPALARRMGGRAPPPLLRTVQTRTDQEGRFRLPDLPLAFHGRTLRLHARHGAHGDGQCLIDPDFNAAEALRIELPGGAQIQLRIVDEQGAPVPLARITDTFTGRSAHADADGQAAILRGSRETLTVRIRASGYVEEQHTAQLGSTPTTVALRSPRPLSGQVIDSDGQPIAARLTLVARDPARGTSRRLGQYTTAAGGRFTFEDAQDGPWEIHAEPVAARSPSTHTVTARSETLVIQLPAIEPEERRLTLRGRVEDHTGKRLTRYNIMLRAVPPQQGLYRAALDGYEFLFTDLRVGQFDVEAWDGPHKRTLRLQLDSSRIDHEVVVRLVQPATVAGRLVAPANATAAGLRVRLRRKDGTRGWLNVVTTDSEGSFRFKTVLPGEYILGLMALQDAAAWDTPDKKLVVAPGDTLDLELPLRAAGRLQIVATDPRFRSPPTGGRRRHREYRRQRPLPASTRNGAPAARPRGRGGSSAGAAVTLRFPDGSELFLGPIRFGTEHFDEPLMPGTYELRVEAPDGTFRDTVTIEAHKTTSVEVVLPE